VGESTLISEQGATIEVRVGVSHLWTWVKRLYMRLRPRSWRRTDQDSGRSFHVVPRPAATPEDMPHHIGRWRVLESLGRGTSSTVFRVVNGTQRPHRSITR